MLRIAVIGAGKWGKNIINTLASLPEVQVVVCARTEQSLEPYRIQFQTATDTSSLISQKKIDAVAVATPGATHAEVALPFIEQGIPTFIEKPLATSLADAERLRAAAHATNTLVRVGHVHLHNPAYQAVKAAVAGAIKSIHFEGMNWGPVRDDMSVLWDWGPHGVALATDLMKGEPPVTAQAWGQEILRPGARLYDTVLYRLRWANGTEATGHLSWLAAEKRVKLTVRQEREAAVFDDTASRKVTIYQETNDGLATAQPDYDAEPPLRAELAAFVAAVQEGKTDAAQVTEGVLVVRILAAIEKSAAASGSIMELR